MTLFEELEAAGAEMSSHRSDLYVKLAPATRAVLRNHPDATKHAKTFASEGSLWLDVPFAYDPFWRT